MKNMNIKNNISVIGGVLLSLFVFVGALSMNMNTVSAATCGHSGIRAEVYVRGNSAFVSLSNDNDNCSVPLNIKSYKMYDTVLSNQVMYADGGMITVDPHSTGVLNVAIPSCASQIDAYIGNGPTQLGTGNNGDVIAWTFASNGVDVGHGFPASNYCTNPTPTPTPTPDPTPTLNGSCSANFSSINAGNNISWSAVASGGNGNYTYSWSGTDGLSGANSSISKAYSIAGAKTATVTITSGNQSIVRNCNSNVVATVASLTASCSGYVPGGQQNNINWSATVSGGNGSYTYSWTGDEGLSSSGQVLSKYYYNTGTKNANLTVTSGDQSVTANCSASISQQIQNSMSVSCYANPSNPSVGNGMNWYASVSGGNGNYTYYWNGTDGLSTNNQNPYMTYSVAGSKYASVSVTSSSGQYASASCYANVQAQSPQVLAYTASNINPLNESAVYLSQVPYTGLVDDLKLPLFLIILIGWSAYVAYIFIKNAGEEVSELSFEGFIPDKTKTNKKISSISDSLYSEAKKHEVLLSASAVTKISDLSNGQTDKAMEILHMAISKNSDKRKNDAWMAIGEGEIA